MTSPTELLLNVLGGLGLFFVGIKMIARHLNAIASEQFRRRLKHASESTGISMAFGVVAGFVTQSGRTTSFLMASFVQGGLIEARRAMPIVLWANFGCTLMVFAAVFPIHLFALFLLGAAGACIAFERPRPMQSTANALFGLALLLFGLRMMSASSAELMAFAWFADAIAFINQSLTFALIAGLLLTLIAQSHMAIVLITIALTASGIFDFNQAIMVILGAHLGSAAITYITGIHFKGEPRQLVIGQIFYNLIGVSLFLSIFVVDHWLLGDTEILKRASAFFDTSVAVPAAASALLLNTITPLLLTLFRRPYAALCDRLSPARDEEELAKTRYLRTEVADNPLATLMLAEKEQLRLLKRLPGYLTYIRENATSMAGVPATFQHGAFAAVSDQIHEFQSDLMSQALSHDDTEWLLNQQTRQDVLMTLEDACYGLWESTINGVDADVRRLSISIVEALDTVLLTAVSAMDKSDPFEVDLLDKMTRDRGTTMEGVRKSYLSASETLTPEARNQILHITSLFERAAWALHRFGELLHESPTIEDAA